MPFSDIEHWAHGEVSSVRQERRNSHIDGAKAPNLATTPLLLALSALALLLIGAVLGGAGVRLMSGPHVRDTMDVPSARRPPMPKATATATAAATEKAPQHANKGRFLPGQTPPRTASLESIMEHYRTDKSKDSKKYSDLFAMLFDPISTQVRNVLEVGMGDGGSMMAWHDYFRNAKIYGMEQSLSRVQDYLSGLPRIQLLKANPLKAEVASLGLQAGSMDIVFESAGLGLKGQKEILPRLWPLVRPGGYYVIEDVSWDRDTDARSYPLLHNPEALPKEVRKIFSENDAFFADTTLGHRAFRSFIKDVPEDLNRFSHNAHVIVLRKRTEAMQAPVNNPDSMLAVATASKGSLHRMARHQNQQRQKRHKLH